MPNAELAGSGTIARAAWTSWRRHTARSLGTGTRAVDAGGVVALVLCAALAAIVSAVIMGTFAVAGTLPVGIERSPFTRITAAGALLGGALPQLLLAATRPRGSALGDLVAVLPVTASARALGERMPPVLLGTAFAVLLAAPLGTFVVFLLQHEPARAARAVGAHLVLVVLAGLVCAAGFERLYAIACRLRLPHAYATGAAVAVLLAGIIALAAPFLVPAPRPDELVAVLSPLEAVAQLSAGAQPLLVASSGASLLGWAALTAALVVHVVRHPAHPVPVEVTRLLVGVRMPRHESAAAVAVHALALARLPQLVLLAAGPVLLAVLLATPVVGPYAALTEPLSAVPLVAPFAIGAFAYGLTHPTSWWVRAIGRDARGVAAERLAASAVVAAPAAIVSAFVLVASGTTALDAAALQLGTGLVLWLAAAVGGILAPWSTVSPLATTVTSAVTFALFALAVVPLQLVAEHGPPWASGAALAVSGAVLLAAWVALTRRRRDDDLVIA